MRLLFTGRGTSGSWQIRGEQLGQACGATITRNATQTQCAAADVVVAIKRVDETMLANLRASGRPWAYDVLDAYPQPACSAWSRAEAVAWVQERIRRLAPAAVIWPNRRMRADCDTGLPGLVLPHHHRPGVARNPIRRAVQLVGYEGSAKYLGQWRPILERECERRGWRFTVSPGQLSELDIVVAFRGGEWDNYAARNWKSNVKLANAHGSGTPFVGQPECGYSETASGAEYWAEDRSSLAMCFDWLESQSTREQVGDRFVQKAYAVDQAAEALKAFLHGL